MGGTSQQDPRAGWISSRLLPVALAQSLPGAFLLPRWSWTLSVARHQPLMGWSRSSTRRPLAGIRNSCSPEVWKTNDFCFRRMGVASDSSPMRLQLRGSRGINSSRRGKNSWPRNLRGLPAKGDVGSQAAKFQVMMG